LQRVVLHGADKIMNGAPKGIHQQHGRGDDEEDAADHHNGRGDSLLAAHRVGERSMQGIERDGQDERPHHQRQERRKDDVAERRQDSDEPGTNQYIQQTGRDPPSEFVIRLRGPIHCACSYSDFAVGCARFIDRSLRLVPARHAAFPDLRQIEKLQRHGFGPLARLAATSSAGEQYLGAPANRQGPGWRCRLSMSARGSSAEDKCLTIQNITRDAMERRDDLSILVRVYQALDEGETPSPKGVGRIEREEQ
jgi:hypothetical protein